MSSNEDDGKQLPVRGTNLESVKIGRANPGACLSFLRDGTRADGALNENEADCLFRISVEDRTEDGRVLDFEGELFPAFAREGISRRFSGLEVLPVPVLPVAFSPPSLGDMHAGVIVNWELAIGNNCTLATFARRAAVTNAFRAAEAICFRYRLRARSDTNSDVFLWLR